MISGTDSGGAKVSLPAFELTVVRPVEKGGINDDATVDIGDAVLAFQVLNGITRDCVRS